MHFSIELLDTSKVKLGVWKKVDSGSGTLADIEAALDIARQNEGYHRVIIT